MVWIDYLHFQVGQGMCSAKPRSHCYGLGFIFVSWDVSTPLITWTV